nr:efflux RND transporter permease subunit [Sulfitobacter albidus]
MAETVAAPIEQEINGVEGMIYMLSQSTGDGSVSITVTFEPGTDLDAANVLVQNRVARAEPRLPEPVRRLGVSTAKSSPSILMIVSILSQDGSRDQLYLSNYARTQIVDRIARIDGVGEARLFAERAYSMRVWFNPDRMAARGLTPDDVIGSLSVNNTQVASGTLNALPATDQEAYQFGVETTGRLTAPESFGDIVISRTDDGRLTRVRDVARVQLGAENYGIFGYQGLDTSIPLAVFQRPGTNALEISDAIKAEMATLSQTFPEGVDYNIVYNPTEFISTSIDKVYTTLLEAVGLVILVVFVFLHAPRIAIIPVLAIPVSLIGTFAVMSVFGFSINTLTLFSLVLVIGIVVDDAIIVVENAQRLVDEGNSPKEAARLTMDEVGGAVIATGLVLAAVFVPAAFVEGVTGAFYRQFAITIATATMISVFVSLTLSPALVGILMKPKQDNAEKKGLLARASAAFDRGFDRLSQGYAAFVRFTIRLTPVVMLIYGGMIGLAGYTLSTMPAGFIPDQDKGYFIAALQLPPGSSLTRTRAAMETVTERILEHPAVLNTSGFAGFDGSTFTTSSNGGAIFATLIPFEERLPDGNDVASVIGDLQGALNGISEAGVFVLQPPPVEGLGNSGGWKLYVQAREGQSLKDTEAQTQALAAALNQEPVVQGAFTLFNTSTPKIFGEIDRAKAEILGLDATAVNQTLESYLGSAYVNDFTFLGRSFRVTAQADAEFRDEIGDVQSYRARSSAGAMVPLGTIADFSFTTGADRAPRYNLYNAVELQGGAAPGVSSGDLLATIERVADEVLADGYAIEWTDLSFQQKQAGNTAIYVFGLGVLFVFLVLAALYESWLLPLAIILIVPMCLLAALVGINLREMDNNILTQIGLIVLVGLACKNAILIVEFAKQAEEDGLDRIEAAVTAARLRLRPILMTSLAFIFGVIPLVIASGAGAELRQILGTTVFAGMIGVTVFGLLFTPVFYVVCRALGGWLSGEHKTRERAA